MPTMASPNPYGGDPGNGNPYYDPGYENPAVSEPVKGGLGDHNAAVTPPDLITSRFAIVVRRNDNYTAHGPAIHDIVNEVLGNLTRWMDPSVFAAPTATRWFVTTKATTFCPYDSLDNFSPCQSHNAQKGNYGFIIGTRILHPCKLIAN